MKIKTLKEKESASQHLKAFDGRRRWLSVHFYMSDESWGELYPMRMDLLLCSGLGSLPVECVFTRSQYSDCQDVEAAQVLYVSVIYIPTQTDREGILQTETVQRQALLCFRRHLVCNTRTSPFSSSSWKCRHFFSDAVFLADSCRC